MKGGLDTENPVHQCEQKTCVQKLVDLQPISCMEYHNLPFLSYFDKLTSTNFLGGVKVLYVFLVDPLPFSSSKQKGPWRIWPFSWDYGWWHSCRKTFVAAFFSLFKLQNDWLFLRVTWPNSSTYVHVQTNRACCSPPLNLREMYSEKSFTVKWSLIWLLRPGWVLVTWNIPGINWEPEPELFARSTKGRGWGRTNPPSLKRLLECNLDSQVAQNQNRIGFFEKNQFQFRPFFRVYGLCSTCSSSSLVGLLQASSSFTSCSQAHACCKWRWLHNFFQGMLFTSLVLFLMVMMSFTALMLVLFLIMPLFLIMNLTFSFLVFGNGTCCGFVVFVIMMFFMITLLSVLLLIVMLFMIALLLLFFFIMLLFVIALF